MSNFENDGRYTIREIEIYLKAHRNLDDTIQFLSEEAIEETNQIHFDNLNKEEEPLDFPY